MTGSPQEESWACQPHLGVGPSGPETRTGGLPSRVRLRGFPGGGGCRASEPRPGPSHLASDAHSPPRLPSAAPGSATTQTQRLAESGRAVPAAGGRRLLPGGCRPCARRCPRSLSLRPCSACASKETQPPCLRNGEWQGLDVDERLSGRFVVLSLWGR